MESPTPLFTESAPRWWVGMAWFGIVLGGLVAFAALAVGLAGFQQPFFFVFSVLGLALAAVLYRYWRVVRRVQGKAPVAWLIATTDGGLDIDGGAFGKPHARGELDAAGKATLELLPPAGMAQMSAVYRVSQGAATRMIGAGMPLTAESVNAIRSAFVARGGTLTVT